jgi:effector-binding domain-containing protein
MDSLLYGNLTETMSYTIDIIPASHRTLAVTNFHIGFSEMNTMGERISAAFETVSSHLAHMGTAPIGPAVASYKQLPDGFDVSAGFPVSDKFQSNKVVKRMDVGGCEVAHTTHMGSYDKLSAAYEAIREGTKTKGKHLSEEVPMWEEYWSDPSTATDKTQTEIFWPVEGD